MIRGPCKKLEYSSNFVQNRIVLFTAEHPPSFLPKKSLYQDCSSGKILGKNKWGQKGHSQGYENPKISKSTKKNFQIFKIFGGQILGPIETTICPKFEIFVTNTFGATAV